VSWLVKLTSVWPPDDLQFWGFYERDWTSVYSQSSGAVWKSRWPSWAPVRNKPTVSVDVKQHFNHLFTLFPIRAVTWPPTLDNLFVTLHTSWWKNKSGVWWTDCQMWWPCYCTEKGHDRVSRVGFLGSYGGCQQFSACKECCWKVFTKIAKSVITRSPYTMYMSLLYHIIF